MSHSVLGKASMAGKGDIPGFERVVRNPAVHIHGPVEYGEFNIRNGRGWHGMSQHTIACDAWSGCRDNRALMSHSTLGPASMVGKGDIPGLRNPAVNGSGIGRIQHSR